MHRVCIDNSRHGFQQHLCNCRFRKKAKKGLAYLQEHGLLGPSADDIAEFFHMDDRLDKVEQYIMYIRL